jgi:hypothetical protein
MYTDNKYAGVRVTDTSKLVIVKESSFKELNSILGLGIVISIN